MLRFMPKRDLIWNKSNVAYRIKRVLLRKKEGKFVLISSLFSPDRINLFKNNVPTLLSVIEAFETR